MKDLVPWSYFLSIKVLYHSTGILLSQQKYMLNFFEKTKMIGAKPSPTPMASSLTIFKISGNALANIELVNQTVGGLQYITLTQLDITFSINKLCQYVHCPTDIHWQALK